MDASWQIIRDRRIVLPRGGEVIREFADHLAADVKQLVENDETGARSFRYVRTGTNHYSLAFTYDCIAASREIYLDPRGWGWAHYDEDEHILRRLGRPRKRARKRSLEGVRGVNFVPSSGIRDQKRSRKGHSGPVLTPCSAPPN